MTGPMDTLGDRMRELHAAGWIEQLSVSDGGLSCGDSDPGDESILFAISMPCGHRGTDLIDEYFCYELEIVRSRP